jgi:hypothetical protein
MRESVKLTASRLDMLMLDEQSDGGSTVATTR